MLQNSAQRAIHALWMRKGFSTSAAVAAGAKDWFGHVEQAPKDPILGVTEKFLADPSPNKINLGVVRQCCTAIWLHGCRKRLCRRVNSVGQCYGHLGTPAMGFSAICSRMCCF